MVKCVFFQAIGTMLAASSAAGQGLDAPPSVRVTAKGGVVGVDGSQDAGHGRLLATHTVHLLTGAGPLAVDPVSMAAHEAVYTSSSLRPFRSLTHPDRFLLLSPYSPSL